MNKVKPELAGGFRDYLPEDMIPRNRMLETIKQVFERFGFLPMDTPGMERPEVLGKEGSDFLIYHAVLPAGQAGLRDDDSPSGGMALRYDLTVPLARVVAANPDLPRPFKRYQFGRVWRGEKQQTSKGRWREFTQLDVDIVGSDSPMADAEIVALMYETMTALGLAEFAIKLNNRKLLEGFSPEMLRTIDKADKLGWEGISRELGERAQEVREFFEKQRMNTELDALLENVKMLGVPEEKLVVDNTVVRGLDYYTGNVFETVFTAPDLQEFGSVISGGRYDNLVDRFAPFSIPAVGASVGVDRLFAAMDQLGLLNREKTTAKVLILNFDPESRQYVQEIATDLRRSDIAAELYLGQEETLKGQLSYATKQEYPVVLIAGPEERGKNAVQLKDMSGRQQSQVSRADIVGEVKKILG